MTDISRKFKGRPKTKQRAQRDDGSRSPRRGRSEGRRPRRARAKKGPDPTALTLMIMLPLLGLMALFVLVNKGEPEVREAPKETMEAKAIPKKSKAVARAPKKRPEVKDMVESKMDEIKQLFQIMSDVRTRNEGAMEEARKDVLASLEDYEQADVLRGSDLEDRGEIDRQKRVITRVRGAARKGLKLLKKAVRDLEREVRASPLSEESKRSVLSGKSQFHKGLQNNPYVLLEKRADIELKVLELFEKHGAKLTTSGQRASFSDSTVQSEYQRLLREHTRLGEEIANSDLSQ